MDFGTFVCSSCARRLSKGWSDDEARQAAIPKFGALSDDDVAFVCDRCYAWLNDVERIAREIVTRRGDDPDKIMPDWTPRWAMEIRMAKMFTALPDPEAVSRLPAA